jgi:hypothetical protein
MNNFFKLLMIPFALLTNSMQKDSIRIEYKGSANKTMWVVYISKEAIPDSEMIVTISYDGIAKDYIVNNGEYSFIKKAINTTPHKIFEDQDDNGFKITICENNISTYYFVSRAASDSLFPKANYYLNHHKRRNDKLILRLTALMTSNRF